MTWWQNFLDKLTDPAVITALAGLFTAAGAFVQSFKTSNKLASASQTLNARLDAHAKRLAMLEDPDEEKKA